ncbi:MAG: hypothetical protein RR047_00705 [Bacilli bacterium]
MKIYLISGKARHGKDTLGTYLNKCYNLRGKKGIIMHISYPLKRYAIDYFGWNPDKESKPRELLQKLGQEIIKDTLKKPDFLVDRIIEDIEILSNFFDVFFITDIRLPEEITKLKGRFKEAISIHINRPGFISEELSIEENNHITETALDNYTNYDYNIINLTLEQLEEDAEKIIRDEEYKNEKND